MYRDEAIRLIIKHLLMPSQQHRSAHYLMATIQSILETAKKFSDNHPKHPSIAVVFFVWSRMTHFSSANVKIQFNIA